MAKIICTEKEYDKLSTMLTDNPEFLADISIIYDIVEKSPTISTTNVQIVKCGEWVNEYLDDDIWWAECSNCKDETHSRYGRVSTYKYCPNCGARME